MSKIKIGAYLGKGNGSGERKNTSTYTKIKRRYLHVLAMSLCHKWDKNMSMD